MKRFLCPECGSRKISQYTDLSYGLTTFTCHICEFRSRDRKDFLREEIIEN